MVSISIIMPTARSDYSIIGLPNTHFLEPTIKSLKKQTFKDFEFILVDGLYDKRPNLLSSKFPFPVKHVPIHPNHRFWFNRKRWFVCAALNTGIIHAEGELLVRIDDCSQFEADYLEKFWNGYQSGFFPLAMHIRYFKGKPARANIKYLNQVYQKRHPNISDTERTEMLHRLYGDKGLVRDTRWAVVEKNGGKMIAPINWYYGYSCVSLEAALKVNGYDELFDADKSLEDVDFGSRLEMAGYKNMFLLDVNHSVIEHEHEPVPENVVAKNAKPIKCNYAIYLLNRKKRRWRANTDKLTAQDLEFIRQESLKPPCSPKPDCYADNCQGKLFKLWSENQPIFNLRSEKLEL